MPNYVNSKLKGIDKFGESTLIDNLKSSICSFFDWATLEAEAFSNAQRPSSGAYGGDYTTLNPAIDPNYSNGQVWQTKHSNWIWEKNLHYSDYQPINISGVYVNNSFVPASSTGIYAHTVDYERGQVIFNSPIPTSSQVYCNHSYKYFTWSISDSPWFREIAYDTFRPDLTEISTRMQVLKKNRVQLPAIIVQTAPSRTQTGLMLGGGQWVYQDVKMNIYSENTWDRDKLIDMIMFQKDRAIVGYDKNKMYDSGFYPPQYPATATGTFTCYPDWIEPENARWRNIIISGATWENGFQQPPYLFYDVVRLRCAIDMPET